MESYNEFEVKQSKVLIPPSRVAKVAKVDSGDEIKPKQQKPQNTVGWSYGLVEISPNLEEKYLIVPPFLVGWKEARYGTDFCGESLGLCN